MHKNLNQETIDFFQEKYEINPQEIILSPGRINIIGEHIDYNDGYVLPAAIDKYICFAFRKNETNTIEITAIDLDDSFEININDDVILNDIIWTNYLRGIINQLKINDFEIQGFDCVFSSNIPIGAGLSSSAALECGFLYGINELFDLHIQPIDIAQMGQKAEHWVGINCGIMDQFSSVMGKENKVLKIDCKTLEFEYHDANFNDYNLILLDSNVKHSLFASEYNVRRMECEEGLKIIKNNFSTINSFRDCNINQILSLKTKMSDNIFNRCNYVVKEIDRVSKACEALDNQNIAFLGRLMFETHEGLSKEYEVSCTELDFLVQTAKINNWSIGSRLMGGGFGGCTINLVKKGTENKFISNMRKLYFDEFGIELKNYNVKISDGTTILNCHK